MIRDGLKPGDVILAEEVFAQLIGRLGYPFGDFQDPVANKRLGNLLGDASRPLFYLEIPPSLFAGVVATALHDTLAEDQILRIDHILGEQPLLDINVLCFANVALEPVWSRDHVAADLRFAEEIGASAGPYERLLYDALTGEYALFTREDCVEETGRVP